MGENVVGAGDVNGDGYDDVVASVQYFGTGDDSALLFFPGGKAGLGGVIASTYKKASSVVGKVYRIGDVNGDGRADIMLSNTAAHAIELRLGTASGLAPTAAWWLDSDTFGGYPDLVAGVGDIDHDGRSDVAVKGHYFPSVGVTAPLLKIYGGTASGLSVDPIWTFVQGAPMQNVSTIAPVGDVNGDGFADVVLANTVCDTEGSRVYFYPGSATGLATEPSFYRKGPAPCGGFGVSPTFAGDINGDGYADIFTTLLGNPFPDATSTTLLVFNGNATGAATTASWSTRHSDGIDLSQFASQVAGLGDANDDGFADLASNAPSQGNQIGSTFGEGGVFAYPGGSAGPSTSWTGYEANSGGSFGLSISAGDINGDGLADLLVGDTGCSFTSSSNDGCIYVYSGTSTGTGHALTNLAAYEPSSLNMALPSGGRTAATQIDIAAFVRSPYGRIPAKLEVEVVRDNQPFTGVTRVSGPAWQDTGTSGARFDVVVSGLTSNTAYHFRARALYSPGYAVPVERSPWYTGYTFHTSCGPSDPDLDNDKLCDDEDADDDNDGTPDALDCAPRDPTRYPGASEIVGDGVDQDCSGADSVTCHIDADGDNYGTEPLTVSPSGTCQGTGVSSNALDCDDEKAAVHPGALDIPGNGIDEDCSGSDQPMLIADAGSDAEGPETGEGGAPSGGAGGISGQGPGAAGSAGLASAGVATAGVASAGSSGSATIPSSTSAGSGGKPTIAQPSTPSDGDSSGCACSVARSPERSERAWLAMLALVGLLKRRRRCRRRASGLAAP
ncbi:MAG TPA: FG-GAP-like repeat-containing protein [Polyangiaceae bacterium]|nr:FG-GAP-like repeat-containing protein [Polyangiaceae bacterium]